MASKLSESHQARNQKWSGVDAAGGYESISLALFGPRPKAADASDEYSASVAHISSAPSSNSSARNADANYSKSKTSSEKEQEEDGDEEQDQDNGVKTVSEASLDTEVISVLSYAYGHKTQKERNSPESSCVEIGLESLSTCASFLGTQLTKLVVALKNQCDTEPVDRTKTKINPSIPDDSEVNGRRFLSQGSGINSESSRMRGHEISDRSDRESYRIPSALTDAENKYNESGVESQDGYVIQSGNSFAVEKSDPDPVPSRGSFTETQIMSDNEESNHAESNDAASSNAASSYQRL